MSSLILRPLIVYGSQLRVGIVRLPLVLVRLVARGHALLCSWRAQQRGRRSWLPLRIVLLRRLKQFQFLKTDLLFYLRAGGPPSVLFSWFLSPFFHWGGDGASLSILILTMFDLADSFPLRSVAVAQQSISFSCPSVIGISKVVLMFPDPVGVVAVISFAFVGDAPTI